MDYNAAADIAKLKANILTMVSRELSDFRTATGLTPSSVSIRFVETTTTRSATREHVLASVDMKFDY